MNMTAVHAFPGRMHRLRLAALAAGGFVLFRLVARRYESTRGRVGML